jgi:hypothetical protein
MATTKIPTLGTLYKAFIGGLKAQGCVFCRPCFSCLAPEHRHEEGRS